MVPPENDIGRFREYLRLLAEMHMGGKLRERIEPSDLVQQTLMMAHERRAQFRGDTSELLRAWLRTILVHNITDAYRKSSSQKRDPGNKIRSLQASMDASSIRLENWLMAEQRSPSGRIQLQEEAEKLAVALSRLPAAQREALLLKHCQGRSLAEIGEQLGRTPEAVAGLLRRGTLQLRAFLKAEPGT